MKNDVTIYSYTALAECADAVKAITWTVGKRAEQIGRAHV